MLMSCVKNTETVIDRESRVEDVSSQDGGEGRVTLKDMAFKPFEFEAVTSVMLLTQMLNCGAVK